MTALLDLVAVAYNAPDELELFLKSISKVDVPFSLTIIDNLSPDPRVRKLLDEWNLMIRDTNPNLLDCNFVYNDSNRRYSRACNQGAQFGQAPIIGLLNCDVQFLDNTASRLIEKFTQPDYHDVAIIGPLTYDENGFVTHAGIFANPSGGDAHRAWMVPIETYRVALQDEQDCTTISGATYFIRRSVWQELTECELYRKVAPHAEGAFLPTQHFYEETWCSYHARTHGYRIRYCGDIEMIHSWHRSSAPGTQSLEPAESQFRVACNAHNIELDW